MTLIIGARCRDGIVIGSDKKISRGGETEYSNKIFEFDIGGKVLFAAEGLTGIRDDFFYLLNYEIRRRRGVDTIYEVKLIVEDIIANLTERYAERVNDPVPVGVLMAGLENLSEGKATVYYIHGTGYGEQISFRSSGSGGEYAYSLAKFLCGHNICSNLSIDEAARRIAFTILWVSEDVDSSVGGLSIAKMKDKDAKNIEYLTDEESKEIEKSVNNLKGNLPRTFGFGSCEEKTAEEKRNEARTEIGKITTKKE
jgi:20S proteasome alpha/beta subunit